ncbi:MAG TPA: carbonic anhydrase [Candidatus Elarobacter sp.]|jgi:carbonic anhydrase|nr:carbonic anhydrase [Candidatus Elarobacter sp.]
MRQSRSAFLTAAAAFAAIPRRAAGAASLADPECRGKAETPEHALELLRAGNRRFVQPPMLHPDQTPARRRSLIGCQKPFAAFVSCADSRVPPEIVFDQGLGDLFVCRTAGNTGDDSLTGSIEYAIAHFHTPLVVVLGHQNCGACQATIDAVTTGVLPHDSVAAVVRPILPAARRAQNGTPEDWLDRTIVANAKATARTLAMSPVLRPRIAAGALQVLAARYSLEHGSVEFFPTAG